MALPRYRSYLGIAKETTSTPITVFAASTPSGGSATYTAANNFVTGQTVVIAGIGGTPSSGSYNGTFVITSATSTTFVVANTATGGTPTYTNAVVYKAGGSTTGANGTPADFIPIKSLTPFDNIKYLEDTNWRGSMVENYGEIQGNRFSEFELTGDVFPDTVGYMIAGTLGDVTTTGAGPYIHAVSTKNNVNGQATSYTLTDYYGIVGSATSRQYAGTQFHELDLKFNADGLLEYSAKGTGFVSAVVTNPTSSFTNTQPIPVWVGTTTLAGTLSSALQEGNISIKRPATPIFTVDGNQDPYQIFQGAVTVDGSLTWVVEDDSLLLNYLNNSQPSLVINWSQTSNGGGATQVQATMTKCAFTVAKIERGKDYVEVVTEFKAIANTTDAGASGGYSPIKLTVKNAKPASTYTY